MKILDTHFNYQKFIILSSICLVCYSSMAVLQAFNADDIIQGQPISNDTNTFLASGRWGYYIIYKLIQEANPLGPAGLIFGILILTFSSCISAGFFNFEQRSSKDFFVIIATVSLYYSSVFSFDSTRIAYPIAILLATLGILFYNQKKYMVAILCFAVSPAIFPASTQVAITIICSIFLFEALNQRGTKDLIINGLKIISCIIIGLLIYIVLTHLSVIVTGIPLSGRSSIDPIAAIRDYKRLMQLFWGHSIPNGYQLYYFTPVMKIFLWILMGIFLFAISPYIYRKNVILVIILMMGVMVGPYALAFASPLNEFTPRALVGFATVHAIIVAISIDFLYKKNRLKLAFIDIFIASSLILLTSIQINSSAFNEYLSSRNDLLSINRMITRIDEVVSKSDIPLSGPIPIVVRYQEATNMSPLGEPSTARNAPWSKEWIFRHIDPRFSPVPGHIGDPLLEAAPPTKWPEPSSIYVDKGVVVVIIN